MAMLLVTWKQLKKSWNFLNVLLYVRVVWGGQHSTDFHVDRCLLSRHFIIKPGCFMSYAQCPPPAMPGMSRGKVEPADAFFTSSCCARCLLLASDGAAHPLISRWPCRRCDGSASVLRAGDGWWMRPACCDEWHYHAANRCSTPSVTK